MPRISLPKLTHELLSAYLRKGDIAIDATVGNGHDTAFLLAKVGKKGHVYGFDIQATAIEATRQLTNNPDNLTLITDSHAKLADYIPLGHVGKIKACLFNLGYLPGGDKRIITQTQSTLPALNAASEVLAVGGILTVLAYPGHPDGDQETAQVAEWCAKLSSEQFDCRVFDSDVENPAAPRLWLIDKICAYP
ncbi:MAG: class I SAM-dependent methyltransferase [Methylovulum sp.]|uniref:class I SAM-dependent methyltransferase n=1 Tax=Methylovulum sp. TaxID=1916980 RepID=UPI0026169522|nr:class I SAM-dependent methyltransferase [Methylovulum sp.]MDD2725488.1 class I SAM-dependent methyltransferase [Methylovulum sp.]MDD5125140.1 class I SAM-dependent methyltransferase [Methylovulum sp.]